MPDTEAAKKTILADVVASNNRTLDDKTLEAYMQALSDLFIIEDMEAWTPEIRSKAALEIKLGGEKLIEAGAASLNKLKEIVENNRLAFRMIVTATGPAYRRKDGIIVAPLNTLRS